MKPSRKSLFLIFLTLSAIIIYLFSRNAFRAENGYSTGIFAGFAPFLRAFTGNWSLSLGDLLYLFLFIFLVFRLGRFLVALVGKGVRPGGDVLKNGVYSFVVFLLLFYIIFNLMWGINYNRKGIAWQLGLEIEKPGTEELMRLNDTLLQKVNNSAADLSRLKEKPFTDAEIFSGTVEAYGELAKEIPFLQYKTPSLKSSMWGTLGNYAGFTGYYNPFTGEAQVNTTVPVFMQPFIACHEVAHQLGYAKEMEANFVGYLAASRSGDPRFLYSVYLDLFLFANNDLWRRDSMLAKSYRSLLAPRVKDDLREWKEFSKRHDSFLDPLISGLYDRFLKSNNDSEGMNSYAKVTALLSAYYKKTGKI